MTTAYPTEAERSRVSHTLTILRRGIKGEPPLFRPVDTPAGRGLHSPGCRPPGAPASPPNHGGGRPYGARRRPARLPRPSPESPFDDTPDHRGPPRPGPGPDGVSDPGR